jgi:hypothetical protein
VSIRDSQYRQPQAPVQAGWWNDPVVKMANEKVSVVSVLNDHFGMQVPEDADGWKTTCPFYYEHEDGGIDRQFRVWAASNRSWCFAMHNVLDPVNLWRYRKFFPTGRDAAESLLTAYGIDFRPKPYQERMAALRGRTEAYVADPDVIVQVLTLYLARLPGYDEAQYRPEVLRTVNLVLSEVHPFCATGPQEQEVKEWLHQAKERLARSMNSPS